MEFKAIDNYDVGQVAALYAATRSGVFRFQTGASLVKHNRVISIGWSHVGETKWAQTPWSTHAEAHAVHRAGYNVKGCDLYIATRSRKGNIAYSRPCESCSTLLKRLGLVNIVYTDRDEWVWSDSDFL